MKDKEKDPHGGISEIVLPKMVNRCSLEISQNEICLEWVLTAMGSLKN